MKDEDLAVAIDTRADTNGRDIQLGCDLGSQLARHAFQHNGAGAGDFQLARSFAQAGAFRGGLALHLIAAHAMHGLRRQPDVADDGNLCRDQALHQLRTRPFDLYRFGTAFLHKAGGIGHSLIHRYVVGAIRHIHRQHGTADAAAHSTRVVQHLVHGDGQGAFEAHHHHGQRVANQQQVDAGLIRETRGGVVISGQRRDRLMRLLAFEKCVRGDFCGRGRTGHDRRQTHR